MIPYGRQHITADDEAAVLAALRSDWITQGPAIPRFEQALAARVGAQFGVAVSNATAGLHIACLALDLGPGDRLWTSPNTFVASANCGLYCGATVDFVDIDPLSLNMSVPALAAKLEAAAASGTLPKVVVPVHFAGQSCDMQGIHALGQRHGFRIIEDASHAVGGSYLGQPVGNGRFSDLTVFSFHPVKIITTAEGGMVMTNDPAMAARLERLRSHGITRDPAVMEGEPEGPWVYEQVELGLNYRLTDLQAALGFSQLSQLEASVARRHQIARRYDAELASLPLTTPWQSPDAHSALHLYPIQVDPARSPLTRRQLFDGLRAAGIGVNVHYIPVHTQPHYRRLGFAPGQFPASEAYYAQAISLPMFPTLTEAQQGEVIAALRRLLG
ncbi:UDP-4-amino-4,6-dideoxy-N-acetyl-beta-L-altrosamine transaminase [Pseudaquabacterium pictum]|uniref:UDP-4-amino-4,6-dideoxy-N-acetyl-beta-L-altrosami ne transaminase n=1 Tax=Pseudaquabacterium pictum TaxID=2315236 RepID=A0A480AM34_9BURK|nr:UDP-4-amino-4,6-dideoxy-N-acetyl-beta-L-altrosamine transaminase [Rubrivivax pictus]GCL62644.1 UDP-4-amino-4,6-dideoxy-N-acetyl-beta-L-altrosami ne transaminase [Rubrivivax pictus]